MQIFQTLGAVPIYYSKIHDKAAQIEKRFPVEYLTRVPTLGSPMVPRRRKARREGCRHKASPAHSDAVLPQLSPTLAVR
jgi:hypothetical protein